jgi:siroheme synthase-like protein
VSLTHSKLPTDHIYYPVFLDISGKPCLVVGGGAVAERKVRVLLRFNGTVRVVSPSVSNPLNKLAEKGRIDLATREYKATDLNGITLVFAATNQESVNRRIWEDAKERSVPVNVVDNPTLCDFIVPSIVKKDPILVAISTSGTLPLLSKKLRKEIAEGITKDYVRYASIIGRFRKILLAKVKDKELRRSIMGEIARTDVTEITGMGFRKVKETFLKSKE